MDVGTVLGLVVFGSLATAALLAGRLESFQPVTHGDGRWARASDLRDLFEARARTGIVLGWLRQRLLQLPAEDNLLVFGVQRSGKTTTVAVPSLLQWRGAVVATSTKEELVALTGGFRSGLGPAYVFAPLDRDLSWVGRAGLTAVTWNPLAEVDTLGAAAELADILTAESRSAHAPHWALSAANLLSGLFVLAASKKETLAATLDRLNATHTAGYVTLAAQAQLPAAAAILRGFSKTPTDEAGSVISTARSALSAWVDERVAAATGNGTNPLDLHALLRSGATLYLVAPAEDAERCRPLFSALLGSLLRHATLRARELGGTLEPRLLLLLDEAANFARVPRLPSYVSTGPGQGIQSVLCFHDLAQLETGYGSQAARTVWNNCRARLLLPGQGDLKTLQLFSEEIGNRTVTWRSRSWGDRGRASESEARTGLPLVAPAALRRTRDAVLIYSDRPPARLGLRRWDQVPRWRSRVDRQAPSRASPTAAESASPAAAGPKPQLSTLNGGSTVFPALKFWLADIYVQPDFNGLPDNLRLGLQHLTNNAAALLLLVAGIGVIFSLIGMVVGHAFHSPQVSERSRGGLMVSAASGALLYAGIAAINYGTGLFR